MIWTLIVLMAAISLGSGIDIGLRRWLLRLAEKNVEKTLRLQGWTEVDVSIGIHPLPWLAGCFWTWRFTRRQYRAERRRAELRRQLHESNVRGLSCGFITPNEARERDAA